MSRHYMFDVHVTTRGELDSESEIVERFALHVQELAAMWVQSPTYQEAGVEISVSGVERT